MEALGVFLQQVWGVADTGTLCSLLRTSRAVGELAHANCEGRVDVRCYKDSLQFSEWLKKRKKKKKRGYRVCSSGYAATDTS
jgi:hypothetical protein